MMLQNTNPVIAEAKKKARYGHRYWLIWSVGETWKNSRLTFDSLKTAIAESNAEHIFLVGANDGMLERYSEGGLKVILSNLDNGYLALYGG